MLSGNNHYMDPENIFLCSYLDDEELERELRESVMRQLKKVEKDAVTYRHTLLELANLVEDGYLNQDVFNRLIDRIELDYLHEPCFYANLEDSGYMKKGLSLEERMIILFHALEPKNKEGIRVLYRADGFEM